MGMVRTIGDTPRTLAHVGGLEWLEADLTTSEESRRSEDEEGEEDTFGRSVDAIKLEGLGVEVSG